MAKALNLLSTLKGSLLEKFYPAGWDLKRIDRCCDLNLKQLTTPARFWSDGFKPVPVKDVSEMDRRMGDAIADQIQRTRKAGRKLAIILPVGPMGMYATVVNRLKASRTPCDHVTTFNMDEWADARGNTMPGNQPGGFEHNLKYRPHDDVIYPAVVRVDQRLAQPPGKYLLYYAPHDTPGGICLAYADKPEGPWIEYTNNPVIGRDWPPHYKVSHVSGPDVIWSEEEQKLFLYFHGENPVTRLASSADGIHFRYEGVAVTTGMFANVSEASYGRVFRHELSGQTNRYIMLLMGNNAGIRRIYLAWSKDGRKWEPRRAPLMDPPPGTDQTAGAVYLPWRGRHYVIAHANNSRVAFNEGYDLYLAETDAAFEKTTPLGKFLDRSIASPSNPAVMSPCFLEEDGRLYLFMNVGPRLRNKIALAVSERE